jgi:hypothetical protein
MRRAYAIGGTVAAVLVTVGAAGAWLGTQYTAQARVVGKGQTRLATSKPPLRLLVENASSLRDVRVTMDGFDLSRYARTDGRGIVVRGINVEDGWHRVRFTAHQKGLFGPAVDRRFGVLVDTRKPLLQLSPTPGGGFRSNVQIAGRTDRGATVEVAWKGAGKPIQIVARDGAFALRPPLDDGSYALRITAIDAAGNRKVTWRKVEVDSTPPELSLRQLGVLGSNDPTIRGTLKDSSPLRVTATLDNRAAGLTGGVRGTGPWKIELHDLTEGEHELSLSVTDAAGNTSTTHRTFTVDSIERLREGYTLGPGARGKDVIQLQRRLRSEGLWKGPFSRFYNDRTMRAVKLYQARLGMVHDGLATPAVITASSGKIIVKLSKFRMWLIKDGKRVFTAKIATGAPGYATPLGRFAIIQMAKNPTWIPPNSPWAAGLEPIPPGPGNPLGSRWIGTSAPAVGFHATPNRGSIGSAASHGCMRMYQEDVEKLYELVAVGMPIEIRP